MQFKHRSKQAGTAMLPQTDTFYKQTISRFDLMLNLQEGTNDSEFAEAASQSVFSLNNS